MAKKKHEYYNRYWEDATAAHFDRRSRERAMIAARMLKKKSGRLLDAGAGRGVVSACFKEMGFDVLALDISQHALAYCRQRGVETCLMDLEVAYPTDEYDVVLALEVLEHLEKPALALKRLVYALAPDGEIVISLPNDRNIYHSQLSKDEDAPHADLYDEKKARALIESCGLQITVSEKVPLLPSWCVGIRGLIAKIFPGAGTISTVFHCVKTPGAAAVVQDAVRSAAAEDPETVEFGKVTADEPGAPGPTGAGKEEPSGTPDSRAADE